jgi:hypothetical protein
MDASRAARRFSAAYGSGATSIVTVAVSELPLEFSAR